MVKNLKFRCKFNPRNFGFSYFLETELISSLEKKSLKFAIQSCFRDSTFFSCEIFRVQFDKKTNFVIRVISFNILAFGIGSGCHRNNLAVTQISRLNLSMLQKCDNTLTPFL